MRRITAPAMPISRSVGWKLSHGEGKGCREAVPNGEQLAGEVSAGRKPEKPVPACRRDRGTEDITEGSAKTVFSCSSLHAPIFDLYFLPVNGAVFRFLRRLFLRRIPASRSRMEGFSSRLIFRLANS